METAIKTTIAKKNSEMEKLEQSKKSHLRMITSSAARLRLKYGKGEQAEKIAEETEARKIRMYETHNPGFCYLKNGECRKKSTSNSASPNLDPIQCSEKIKAILFTDNELDIYKTMCLHLLGTHVQNKNHIQRKDGRLCSYVKAQLADKNVTTTLQSLPQRINTNADSPTKYDKMLPRYILDAKIPNHRISTGSFKYDHDSGSDDESKKKRKLLVPVFVNNEIRMIINSVMEALEAVKSSKLQILTDFARSPEELRDMLTKEEIQEFISELAKNPLVMKPTSYVFVMAHLMFDKSNMNALKQSVVRKLRTDINFCCLVPEKGTLETVAQVLEVFDDSDLRNSLHQIRRGILYRHLQLTNPNLIYRMKNSIQEKMPPLDTIKVLNPSINSGFKYIIASSLGTIKQDQEDSKLNKKEIVKVSKAATAEKENQTQLKQRNSIRQNLKNFNMFLEKISTDEKTSETESSDDENLQRRSSVDSNKCDLHSLTNSQRILLGLKVASLKSRPINMHQFEGKKKVDLAAIMNPIIRPQVCDVDYKQNSPENHLRNFDLPERKNKTSISKISKISTTDLENLTRELLANLRLEISETENKKRVTQFMAKI